MERTVPSSEEDVFVHRGESSTSNLVNSRSPLPSILDLPAPTRQSRQFPDYQQKPYGLGFTPPIRRGSPLNPQKGSQRRSLQGNVSVLDSPPLRHRRIPSPGITDMGSPALEQEPDATIFSNEYDLAHEDPRIMLDVQRALKLKARREARLKREQSASPQHVSSPSTVNTPASTPEQPQSLWKTRFPNVPSSPSSPTPPRKTSNTSSEIDFSPATGLSQLLAYPHPVPSSLDNGSTLDWTCSFPDEDKGDKRWLMMGKRKDKDKILPLNAMAEQQEYIYRDKLEKIRSLAGSQTQRKAAITREQLGRRYRLFFDHESTSSRPFNILEVARWYSSIHSLVKQSIEKAEPFSWLKHLEKASQGRERSPWHLSALVMEEYLQAQSSSSMPTIPEDDSALRDPLQATSSSKGRSNTLLASPDGVSFEPRRDSAESSEGRRGKGSTESTSSLPLTGSTSKAPFKPRSIMSPRQYHQGYTTGDVSSMAESMSDVSEHDPIESSAFVQPARRSEHPSPQIQVIVSHDSEERVEQEVGSPIQFRPSTSSKISHVEPSPHQNQSTPLLSSRSTSRAPLPRRIHISHPPPEVFRRPEDDEEALRRDYEARARLLEEAHAHNHRVRQTLNRISAAVREYDTIQNAALKTPGIPHLPLPRELIEAFSHDPAAVTGSTRRLSGWRAVEDIHQRVIRQREIFQSFLPKCPVLPHGSVQILDEPISRLMETLDVLQTQRDEIMSTATNLTELLHQVQSVHQGVKGEYNATVSRTSVVYPELSHIVALEESYRDQYQQLWDFGMDALTLLLDTVTPFWRNHGKTIGEDVRDFLIIPLYRNEFTGEAKRYPLTEVPRRSLQHWLGLVLFFFLSIAVTFLQVRAAITSSVTYRLQWIPYDGVRWTVLPLFWIGIVIQWTAVLFEFSVVVMQLGIVAWWAGWLINIFQ